MCGIGHREREREREIYVLRLRLRFSCQIRLRERNCSIFEYFLDYICIYINRVCGIGQREIRRGIKIFFVYVYVFRIRFIEREILKIFNF